MKIIFQTRKKYDEQAEKELERNKVLSNLMRLCARSLVVNQEAYDYLKAIGPQSVWANPMIGTLDLRKVTSYEDLMSKLNSLLNRNDRND